MFQCYISYMALLFEYIIYSIYNLIVIFPFLMDMIYLVIPEMTDLIICLAISLSSGICPPSWL